MHDDTYYLKFHHVQVTLEKKKNLQRIRNKVIKSKSH